MPLYSLVVTNIHTEEVAQKHFHLSEFSYFQRKPIREYIMMISKELSKRLQTYDFQVFEQKFNEMTITVFVKIYNEYAYVSCGKEYPVNIANKFLSECRTCCYYIIFYWVVYVMVSYIGYYLGAVIYNY